MSRKLLVVGFEWVEDTSQFNEDFIKSYNEESDEEYFFEVDVQYSEKLHDLHNDFIFLPKRLRIEKAEKLVAKLHDKTEYVIYIKHFSNQTLNHELVLKNVHRVIQFNWKSLTISWFEHWTKKKSQKNYLEKYLLKLMNNSAF